MANKKLRYQNLPKNIDDEGFSILKQYYTQTKFVNHQINQFNHFIEHGLKEIILRDSTISTENVEVKFLDVKVERPYYTKKVIKKNKTANNLPVDRSCIETTSDASSLECGEMSSYEIVPLFPNEARKRNINYDGVIYVSIEINNLLTNKKTIHHNISIGKLPIMLHSKACWLTSNCSKDASSEECVNDFGGYFIIKGKERVLVSQLRKAYNRVYVEQEDSMYTAEIRSMNKNGSSILVQLKYNSLTNELLFSLPYIKTKSLLPAGLVFKALGISEENMLKFCKVPENIKILLQNQYQFIKTVDDAIKIIAVDMLAFKEKELKKTLYNKNKTLESFYNETIAIPNPVEQLIPEVIKPQTSSKYKNRKPPKTETEESTTAYIKDVFQNEIFYHIGKLTPEKTGTHLGYMIKKIISTARHERCLDDRDNIANKRVDACSSLLSFLFQILFKQFTKTVFNQIDGKKTPDPLSIMKDVKIITNVLNQAFMTGSWNTQKSSSFTRVGVSQVLSMQNYGAKMSHLRRIMLPIGGKGKNSSIRQLHPSHFSFICPSETPEGETVGIVSNLALSAHITVNTDSNDVITDVSSLSCFENHIESKCLILINGHIIGSCQNARIFKLEFNVLRLQNEKYSDVGMIHLYYENEIHIETDEGRFIRPLFNIGNRNEILYKEFAKNMNKISQDILWNEYVKHGCVVFRDVWELEQSVVAMTEEDLQKNKCNYLEICPSATMMAIMASVIPLSNHSQSPRNAYQASMGKQAIGIPSTGYKFRYDTTLHVINTPQKPITRNNMVSVLHFDEMSHGAMAIVAIMTFSGFNQEDSIVLNKASIDRGLFATTTYKTIVEEEKKKGKTDLETICLPKHQYRNRNYDYSYLNENGIVWKSNVWLKKGTVLVGKITKKILKNEDGIKQVEIVDTSLTIKHGEEGYLDNVLITVNGDGARVIKIRVRIPRRPEIGDKFASSTAQKGTCGMIFSQEDLPFDKAGIQPDLIINPHAIPSRMTINMLIEMFFNRVGCELGIEMDATPFKHRNIEEELAFWAEKAEISLKDSTLMDGRTGEQIQAKIFMAPCFYQRLKHLVSEKIHARMTGPLDTLTHQPVAGRAKNGALRFGEMEKDALLAHGSTRVLKENLYDKSDAFVVPVCVNCGKIPNKRVLCDTCGTSFIELKNMPYATKLLLQELTGMFINTHIY